MWAEYWRPHSWALSLTESLTLLFIIVAAIFVPFGQQIGASLKAITPPLHGYILNILGSLAGVLAFTAVSFLGLGPWWWFGGVMLALLWFVRTDKLWFGLNLVIGIVTILVAWFGGEMYLWTPYHALAVQPLELQTDGIGGVPDELVRAVDLPALRHSAGFCVRLSGDFYQMALDLSSLSVRSNASMNIPLSQYELQFNISDFPYKDVLVVGAGTGNDVAAALRYGVPHIDAVEIDPGILRLGQIAHPEQPYSDPRVHVFIDDARSFFNKRQSKYDMIIFGNIDAHRLFSSMSSLRLDSFLYTVESLQEARRLLKEDGIVVIHHALGNPYLEKRLFAMCTAAFGEVPYMHYLDPETHKEPTFFNGPGVEKFIKKRSHLAVPQIALATDDWPFFYLAGHTIPPDYRLVLEAMALLTLVCVVIASQGKIRTVNGHFFFLGAAFLLIETISVTRFSLLFGSTWVVNSIVFSAILFVILLANLWMNRIVALNIHLLYGFLVAAVVVNYLFPVHVLLSTGLATRLLVSMMLMALPIFFAAFIFAHSYKQTTNADLAFASNLLGAVFGGLVEYSSLIIGFRRLFLIALALYMLSYLALLLPSRKATAVNA